jgi:hypothetical protein
MNAALKPAATLKAFLDWESRQEVKYEFDGFQPVATTGGTAAHAAIQRNLIGLLYNRLRGHRYQAFDSELNSGWARHSFIPIPSSCVRRCLPTVWSSWNM